MRLKSGVLTGGFQKLYQYNAMSLELKEFIHIYRYIYILPAPFGYILSC